MEQEAITSMNKEQYKDKRILVVFPHPDDEAFAAAGTLSLYVEGGAQITYACLTLGEMGRNMGIPPFASRVTLPAIRKQELIESAEAIGIQDLRMLGFHDKMVEFEDPQVLENMVSDLLEEVQPLLVITFYPGYSVHPDHDATGAAVVGAVSKLPAENRPTLHCVAFSNDHEREIGKADILMDVTTVLDKKMKSISAHRSQFQAAELVGNQKLEHTDLIERFGVEPFWTYSFQ
ncbi:1D-myo-inositol 2-acetamido-2-deoxy-alpha-D-glucopyranoside deacetylase [compost metagenome]